MSDIGPNHELFPRMMQKGRLDMPFSDFEDNVMQRIHEEQKYRETASKDGRLSLLFFLLGAGFGLILNIFLSQFSGHFLGASSEKIILFFQVTYVLLVFSQLESVIKLRGRLR